MCGSNMRNINKLSVQLNWLYVQEGSVSELCDSNISCLVKKGVYWIDYFDEVVLE